MHAAARQRFFHVPAGADQAHDVFSEVLTFDGTQAETEENGMSTTTMAAGLPPSLVTIVLRTAPLAFPAEAVAVRAAQRTGAAVSGQTMPVEEEPTWEDAEWQ